MTQVQTFGHDDEVATTLPEDFVPLMSNDYVESDHVQPDYAPQYSGS